MPPQLRVLFVDPDRELPDELAAKADGRWDVVCEVNGGAALDLASAKRFDVVLCRDDLPDLKGTLVLKSIQAVQPDAVGFVLTGTGSESAVQRYSEGRVLNVDRPFRGAKHLSDLLDAAVADRGATEKERRVLRTFRSHHEDFLRRYARLKLRIERILVR